MYYIIFQDNQTITISNDQAIALTEAFNRGEKKFIINKEVRSFYDVRTIKKARDETSIYKNQIQPPKVEYSKEQHKKNMELIKKLWLKKQ